MALKLRFLFIVSSLFIWTLAQAMTKATITLVSVTGEPGTQVQVPIRVSTDSSIGIAQFVVEYNRAVLAFKLATNGADTPDNFGINNINNNLPFAPSAPGTDANVLVQSSGGGTKFFTGAHQEIVLLHFDVVGNAGESSPLVFDPNPKHTYLSTINLSDIDGSDLTFENGVFSVPMAVDLDPIQSDPMPGSFAVVQNYPNPFNAGTRIYFRIPLDSIPPGGPVSLSIFNERGEQIRSFLSPTRLAGQGTISWDGCDQQGNPVCSGIYLLRLAAGTQMAQNKMILLR